MVLFQVEKKMNKICNIGELLNDDGDLFSMHSFEKEVRMMLKNLLNCDADSEDNAWAEYVDVLKAEVLSIPSKSNGAIIIVQGSDIAQETELFFKGFCGSVWCDDDKEFIKCIEKLCTDLSSSWIVWNR